MRITATKTESLLGSHATQYCKALLTLSRQAANLTCMCMHLHKTRHSSATRTWSVDRPCQMCDPTCWPHNRQVTKTAKYPTARAAALSGHFEVVFDIRSDRTASLLWHSRSSVTTCPSHPASWRSSPPLPQRCPNQPTRLCPSRPAAENHTITSGSLLDPSKSKVLPDQIRSLRQTPRCRRCQHTPVFFN